jgi:hypothetical protein
VPRMLSQKLWYLAALLILTTANNARAEWPLTPFKTAEQAQRHCPTDKIVWLDLQTRVYYVPGQRRYARGQTAAFVCREEARRAGNRRSLLGRR